MAFHFQNPANLEGIKEKVFSVEELCDIKKAAFRLGKESMKNGEDAFSAFMSFYQKNGFYRVQKAGHIMEVIIAFVFGSMQAFMGSRAFGVRMSVQDDRHQIDFRINGAKIQVKYAWGDEDFQRVKKELARRNILAVDILLYRRYDVSYSILDTIVEMLEFAGVSESKIKKELDEDPALDLAERVWAWYADEISF